MFQLMIEIPFDLIKSLKVRLAVKDNSGATFKPGFYFTMRHYDVLKDFFVFRHFYVKCWDGGYDEDEDEMS